ncbi:MAG: HAMP domain-containing sensor histidine kinase [Bacteroidota bacterium]|nr:HAMP domain-containing sensor histidine kinase [Bacteroidota bacterium]
MKLQQKINKRFLLLLLLVFIAAGGALYFVLSVVIDENIDEILSHRAHTVKRALHQHPFPVNVWSLDQSVEVQLWQRGNIPTQFSDTMINTGKDHESVTLRKMVLGETVNGQAYKITLLLSRLESEDFAGVVFWFMLGIFALIILLLFLLNRRLSASIWYPFFTTLEKMKDFSINGRDQDKTIPCLYEEQQTTGIDEFDQLNLVLSQMTRKIQDDFTNLKEFTENASHETQTPLAIVKSKLETVLQDKALTSEQHWQIKIAYEAAIRLSKLNEALLLLSKIENSQFLELAELDLSELVVQRLEFIEEFVAFKHIEVTCNLQAPFIVKMNPYLAEILVNNLLGNAIRHNLEGGKILIASTPGQLVISNTGKPLEVAPEKLFQRFVKHNSGNESTGLGLAIVSEICLKSGLKLEYNYDSNFHYIILLFNV